MRKVFGGPKSLAMAATLIPLNSSGLGWGGVLHCAASLTCHDGSQEKERTARRKAEIAAQMAEDNQECRSRPSSVLIGMLGPCTSPAPFCVPPPFWPQAACRETGPAQLHLLSPKRDAKFLLPHRFLLHQLTLKTTP